MAAGRKTGGRQKGTPNKRTTAAAAAAKLVSAGASPLDFLLETMRGAAALELRLEAAKAAAPYVHPRLASVTLKGDEDEPIRHVFEWSSQDEPSAS